MRNQLQVQLLADAVRSLGGESHVCKSLRVQPALLALWMKGKSAVPMDLFLKLVDLVMAEQGHGVYIERSLGLIKKTKVVLQRSAVALEQSQHAEALLAARHPFFAPTFHPKDRHELLQAAFDASLFVAQSDLGNMQIVDVDGSLRIEAHRGFFPPFLKHFAVVSSVAESACGEAMLERKQVFVPDVEVHPLFAGTPAGDAMIAAGSKAVSSTPIVDSSGRVVAMMSAHYREPHAENQSELALLHFIAKKAASWLELQR